MKKIITIIIFIFAVIFTLQDTYASEFPAESSAKLANQTSVDKDYMLDARTKALEVIFKKYNSKLFEQAQFFVRYADEFGVDWKMLPAISGLESSFGKFLMQGSYNAYGWGGGYIYFESWEDGIRVINKALRENYINRGAADVWSIGPIYAESKTWAVRVNHFMNEINEEYLRLSLFSVAPTI